MTAVRLLDLFDRVSAAPGAVPRLRQFILELAVRGKLVEQDPQDEPASALLKRLGQLKLESGKRGHGRPATSSKRLESVEERFTVPVTWTWCRLADMGSIVAGGTPPSGDADNFAASGGGIPWLTPADLGRSRNLYVSRGQRDLTEQGLQRSSATLLPKGSVLFTSRAPIGYTAIAAQELSTNQGFKSVVPFIAESGRYIATYFQAFARWIDSKAPGTTFREVSGKIVSSLPFPLPPLPEQQRIVDRADDLMALCDRLEAAQAEREMRRDRVVAASLHRLTEPTETTQFRDDVQFHLNHLRVVTTRVEQIRELRQAILGLAVRGRLVAQVPDDEPPQSAQPSPRGAETPFEIPTHWIWSPLAAVGHMKGGGTPSKGKEEFWNGTIPWVSPKDMKRDYIDSAQMSITPIAVTDSAATMIPAGSILFVVRGMILSHSFPVAIATVPLTINQDMKAITLKNPEYAEYLLRALKGLKPLMLARVQRSTHGTCRIEGRGYSSFPVPLPPVAEQQRIVVKVDELMALCDRLEAQIETAATEGSRLLEALLHEALTGASAIA